MDAMTISLKLTRMKIDVVVQTEMRCGLLCFILDYTLEVKFALIFEVKLALIFLLIQLWF